MKKLEIVIIKKQNTSILPYALIVAALILIVIPVGGEFFQIYVKSFCQIS
jgi:hypothetical protein